jgi:hypothetical protein
MTLEVLSTGVAGNYNGALQVVYIYIFQLSFYSQIYLLKHAKIDSQQHNIVLFSSFELDFSKGHISWYYSHINTFNCEVLIS